MNYLRKFSDIVGYSDHSNPEVNANVIPATAIYLGAQLIERHFTILKKKERNVKSSAYLYAVCQSSDN